MAFVDELVKAANKELRFFLDKGCRECESPCRERIAKYWRNIGMNLDGCDDQAWSAAFICFCMTGASMPQSEFPFSASHQAYIRWSIINQKQNKPSKTYYGRQASDYSPKVGDMVARARQSGVDYDHIPDAFFKSHCDIVVGIEPGKVLCVGGNVSNRVRVTKYAINSQGRIINPASQKIICVMECRKS